jgi:hypothetical protein
VAGFLVGQRLLQLATATVPAGSPFGYVEAVNPVPGGIHVIGWTIDPSSPTTSINVSVYSDGTLVSTSAANGSRPDVAAHYPDAGPNHGFDFVARPPEGTHTICVDGVNVGPGALRSLSCRSMTLRYSPITGVNTLATSPGHVVVNGWAFDPDSPTTVLTVNVTIDATVASSLTANVSRPDVANVYPSAGPTHGFSATVPMAQGTHNVCLVAKNVQFGHDTTARCSSLTLNDSPIVHLDVAKQVPGGYYLAGWGFDPNSPQTSLTTKITVDGTLRLSFVANAPRQDVANMYPAAGAAHGFTAQISLSQGSHSVCVTAVNISYGSDRNLLCGTVTVNFNPSAGIDAISQTTLGAYVKGWAVDPDTSAAITTLILADGHQVMSFVANAPGSHAGHSFAAIVGLTSGTHTICVVGVNVDYGTGNSPSACRSITLTLSPFGSYDSIGRAAGSTALLLQGWAADPDSVHGALTMTIWIDGSKHLTTANATRTDVGQKYPAYGSAHGFVYTFPASDWEHKACVWADNVGAGQDVLLGCKTINAVHPVPPSAPQSVKATAGFGGATVTWAAPASDGGAPWTQYRITASPGGANTTATPGATSATITGLAASTQYTFSVVAVNVAGTSPAGVSPAVKTLAAPPPQTTPAPISTSRYIRNISGALSGNLSTMYNEGAADAKANPSGHGYLILLDIGGQDQADGGVVLSATTRFVSYGDLVKNLNSYVDGYHSAQRSSAPIMVAIGTNNDMDVSSSSGATWASTVVNQVAAHASSYLGMTIAGANDIEPGFRGSYAASKAWLQGFLGATKQPFVFNGSADGCSWTTTNSGCNNGWNMSGLYYLAAGAAPVRIINLPQIYNTAMAGQWKYISLTGIGQHSPRINFGGPLTEWTACQQAGGCGSLTGNSAWQALWNNLQSVAALKVSSLPYSTDLRIDR